MGKIIGLILEEAVPIPVDPEKDSLEPPEEERKAEEAAPIPAEKKAKSK